MPTGPGGLDAQGVYLYGEDDTEALVSDQLNLAPASISDQFVLDRARLTAVEVLTASDAWAAPTLQNSWVNFGAPYANAGYKRHHGIVLLRGVIKSGTLTSGTLLFTLPAGFRPASTLRTLVLSSTTPTVVDISNNGEVRFSGAAPSSASLSLDTVRFLAEV